VDCKGGDDSGSRPDTGSGLAAQDAAVRREPSAARGCRSLSGTHTPLPRRGGGRVNTGSCSAATEPGRGRRHAPVRHRGRRPIRHPESPKPPRRGHHAFPPAQQ